MIYVTICAISIGYIYRIGGAIVKNHSSIIILCYTDYKPMFRLLDIF